MGLTTAKVELRNPRRPDIAPVTVEALADTGADHLCIPEDVQRLLALEQADTKTITLTDGTARAVPYVGPLQLRLGNRTGFAGALVMGDQPLLGAIALQDMDLVVIPKTRQVVVNPASPDMATGSARLNVACMEVRLRQRGKRQHFLMRQRWGNSPPLKALGAS